MFESPIETVTVFERVNEKSKRHEFFLQIANPVKKESTVESIADYLQRQGCQTYLGNPGFKVFFDPEGNFSEVIFVEVNGENDTEEGKDIPDLVRNKLQEYSDAYMLLPNDEEDEQ